MWVSAASWVLVQHCFSAAEKGELRQAITGEMICPARWFVDPDKLGGMLLEKLGKLLQVKFIPNFRVSFLLEGSEGGYQESYLEDWHDLPQAVQGLLAFQPHQEVEAIAHQVDQVKLGSWQQLTYKLLRDRGVVKIERLTR